MPHILNLSDKIVLGNKNTVEGHRKRLRDKFLQSGLAGFHDYEIVELLLTLGTPRKDCKQIAKETIKEFGGLREVLDASIEELQKINGIGPSNAFGIKLFQAISERYSKETLRSKVSMSSAQAIAEYLQKFIGREKKEHFVMLSLDSRYNLIKISNISLGSVNASVVHPREVFKEAIQASASQIIIAHNHPSGDPEASPEDVALTRRLAETARVIGIELLDHIIVTTDGFQSLKDKDLI
ncbi:DNA repair protein RadC [Candidatus Saccharibacteria bacterium]|nr:DNA repair protein RadC [Candidatus Saccharibacteria bacterium]